VWKVEVKVGDKLKNEQIVAVLEAMKLEIPVKAEQEGGVVEKVLVKPNDVVEGGRPLVLLRKPKR
jgi:urea carboxylase